MKAADVIVQHCSDGRLIPLFVRFDDEEGLKQQFKVSGYRVLEKPHAHERSWIFEIAIIVRDQKILMKLIYSVTSQQWMIERIM